MAIKKLTFGLAATILSVPAAGSVIVLGTSAARLCFEEADSGRTSISSGIQSCDLALSQEPLTKYETVATHVNRGILRLRKGDVDNAVADFDTAIRLDPNQPEAYLNKGTALVRRNQADQALQHFTTALEKSTARPALAHFGRAVAHETLGNVSEAYRDYRRASELDPDWMEPKAELQRFKIIRR